MTDMLGSPQGLDEPPRPSIYSRLKHGLRSAGSFVSRQFWTGRRIIIGIALVLVVATAHLWAPAWWQSVRDVLFPAEGKIIVGSPAVYTRQRLVNDRLAQTSWLQDQLKVTERDQPFRGIDEVRVDAKTTGTSLAVSVGAKPGGSDGGGNPSGQSDPAKADKQEGARVVAPIEPTTSDLFRMKNTYREAVRAEIMETQLDDRHDIRGNTIYRLTFDATVLPGAKTDALAIIKVTLSHNPKDLRDEYRELYYDWMRRMQVTVDESMEGITNQLAFRRPDLRIRLTLMEFVLRKLCEKLLKPAEQTERERPCDPDQTPESPQMAAARKTLGEFGARYRRFRDAAITREAFADLASDKNAKDLSPEELKLAFAALQDACMMSRSITASIRLKGKGDKVDLWCPRTDVPAEGLIGAVILYERLRRNSVAEVMAAFDPVDPCPPDRACLSDDLTVAEYRCIAAEYMQASLEAFGRATEKDRKPISTFFNTRIVGRDVGSCDLLFVPNWNSDTPQDLAKALNSGIELYSYSVTPKNLVQHVATASDTRDAVQALLNANFNAYGQQSSALADNFRRRSSQSQRVQSNPIVVGFGIGRKSYSPSPNNGSKEPSEWQMQFGWAIAPQFQDDVSERKHSERQYSLAAHISVPSWWLSVAVRIETCWAERKNLEIRRSVEVCPPGSSGSNAQEIDVVRLPGAMSEVSLKLGFDVVQEPWLDPSSSGSPDTPIPIETGRPASVLLNGGRIWRSTEVTLGSQKADEIVVLPNMQGILAKFRCVRRQLPKPGPPPPDKLIRVPVNIKVWTSEGVTKSAYAELITPIPEAAAAAATSRNASDRPMLCPDELRDLGIGAVPAPLPAVPVPVPVLAPAAAQPDKK